MPTFCRYYSIVQNNYYLNLYAFISAACRKKKMVNNQCPVCNNTNSSDTTFRAFFLYSTSEKSDQKITLFQSTLEKILKQTITYTNKDNIIDFIIGKLPIQFSAAISASNTLYNIELDNWHFIERKLHFTLSNRHHIMCHFSKYIFEILKKRKSARMLQSLSPLFVCFLCIELTLIV